jgi:fucose permease
MTSLTTATYPAGLTRAQVLAWRNATFAIFAVCGIFMATWLSRVPSIRDIYDATPLQMAGIVFGAAVGSIVGLTASSHVVALWGSRRVIVLSIPVGLVGLLIAGLGATIGPVVAVTISGLVIFGLITGLADVAMNLTGAINERAIGRPIMPVFHAFFSIGTIVGAALGALAEAQHIPIITHFAIVAVVLTVTVVVSVRFLQPDTVIEDGLDALEGGSSTWRERVRAWRSGRTLLIGLVVLGMVFAEGSAGDWLALGVVHERGFSKPNGVLTYAVFVTAMTAGRFAGMYLLERFGRVSVLRASAVSAAIGLAVVIFVPVPAIIIVGVVLWGLGSALGFPVGMSAAADDSRNAAANVSAVATIGYFGFLVGPPLIGLIGEFVGYLGGLSAVLVLVFLAFFASGAAREPQSVRQETARAS